MGWLRALCAAALAAPVGFLTQLGVSVVAAGDTPPVAATAVCLGLITVSAALAGIGLRWFDGRPPSSLSALVALSLGAVAGLTLWRPYCAVSAFAAAGVVFLTSKWAASRLPDGLEGLWERRRPVAALVVFAALASVVQAGRFSLFMAQDPSQPAPCFIAPKPSTHMCLSAYLHAAELHRMGVKNVYLPERYDPGLQRAARRPGAGARTAVVGMGNLLKDPFQYPPPALLLPRLALAWFALQASAVLGLLALIAGALNETARRAALLGLLLFWLIPSVLTNFEYGQIHLLVICCTVLAMIAFERERPWVGGLLLACAISIKLYPGFLLFAFLWRRRIVPPVTTAVCVGALAALTLVTLGADPFVHFYKYQVPRLLNGEAFGVYVASGDIGAFQMSAAGTFLRLKAELTSSTAVDIWTRLVSLAYYTGLAALVLVAGRRRQSALAWLALANLAASASLYSPAQYVMSGSACLFVFWIAGLRAERRQLFLLGALALVAQVAPVSGYVPVLWRLTLAREVLMAFAFLMATGLNVWCVLAKPARERAG